MWKTHSEAQPGLMQRAEERGVPLLRQWIKQARGNRPEHEEQPEHVLLWIYLSLFLRAISLSRVHTNILKILPVLPYYRVIFVQYEESTHQ